MDIQEREREREIEREKHIERKRCGVMREVVGEGDMERERWRETEIGRERENTSNVLSSLDST